MTTKILKGKLIIIVFKTWIAILNSHPFRTDFWCFYFRNNELHRPSDNWWRPRWDEKLQFWRHRHVLASNTGQNKLWRRRGFKVSLLIYFTLRENNFILLKMYIFLPQFLVHQAGHERSNQNVLDFMKSNPPQLRWNPCWKRPCWIKKLKCQRIQDGRQFWSPYWKFLPLELRYSFMTYTVSYMIAFKRSLWSAFWNI